MENPLINRKRSLYLELKDRLDAAIAVREKKALKKAVVLHEKKELGLRLQVFEKKSASYSLKPGKEMCCRCWLF